MVNGTNTESSDGWLLRLKFLVLYPAVIVAGPAVLAVVSPTYGFIALMVLAMAGGGYVVFFGEDLRADSMAASVYAGSKDPNHHTNPSSGLSHGWPMYVAGGVAVLSIAVIIAIGM